MKKKERFKKRLWRNGKITWLILLVPPLIILLLLCIWFLWSYVETMIGIEEYLKILKELLLIVALVIGVFIGILVSRKLVPVLDLQIQSKWVGEQKKFLKLTFEVTNKSVVILNKPEKGNMFSVQFLPYNFGSNDIVNKDYCLTEWVPFKFNKDEGNPRNILPTNEYRHPKDIFTTTIKIEPGETIRGERLYYPSTKATAFKVGLQVSGKMHNFISLIMLCFGMKTKDRWTTTRVLVRPGTDGNAQ